MRVLLLAMLTLSAALALDVDSGVGKITCWDLCSARCKAKYGRLTTDCVGSCGCTCDSGCEKLCLDFDLGAECRLKCGCFQNVTFAAETAENSGEEEEELEERHRLRGRKGETKTVPETVAEEGKNKSIGSAVADEVKSIAGGIKEVAKEVIDCAKTCKDQCTGRNYSTLELIKCLEGCSCDKTERLVQAQSATVRLDGETRSFGRLRWGTFFVIFFILGTIATGVFAIYKKYNVVKAYRRNHRALGEGEVIYQRII